MQLVSIREQIAQERRIGAAIDHDTKIVAESATSDGNTTYLPNCALLHVNAWSRLPLSNCAILYDKVLGAYDGKAGSERITWHQGSVAAFLIDAEQPIKAVRIWRHS